MPKIFTIGFTKKSLREFIEILRAAGVKRVVDVRLRNTSQLAGWSKQPDFGYLLQEGFGIAYEHHPEFAPNDELLDEYKKGRDWTVYEDRFNRLLAGRNPEKEARELLKKGAICLLCAEPKPDKCHRRLVADFMQSLDPRVEVEHL
jgi:uncharacterized protein (DUF488 family)